MARPVMQQARTLPFALLSWRKYLSGLILAGIVSLIGMGIASIEEHFLGHAIIEALVAAILVGIVVRNVVPLSQRVEPGIHFSAKQVLEVAVALLGAGVDVRAILAAGPTLFGAIVLMVAVAVPGIYFLGRLLGLHSKLALLVAAGNSICGNSAIAALAPVIKAEKRDVASSIALTAILGVIVVLALPLLIPLFGLSFYQYGVLAGMTVYAVPQVLASAFPVSQLSGEVATLVKLVRVLMLGPVILICGLVFQGKQSRTAQQRLPLGKLVPWFIVVFLGLIIVRTTGILPDPLTGFMQNSSRWLTVIAMAGLGLGVDIRSIRQVGFRVGITVIISLLLLLTISLSLIFGLHLS